MPGTRSPFGKTASRLALTAVLLVVNFLEARADPVRIYDADSEHLWNRLHRALFIRTSGTGREFGHDGVNVLLWPNTSQHLVAGESRARVIAVLHEFLEKRGETQVPDPVRRALLQRDLWSAFDWAAESNFVFRSTDLEPPLREVGGLLARTIARLGLTARERRSLPDTYQRAVASRTFATAFDATATDSPFLPADLFNPTGEWVCIGETAFSQGEPLKKLVPRHVEEFSRSVFFVFIRLPEGREATNDYLKRLNDFPTPWQVDGRRIGVHRDVPEFPHGTQLALLRCAMVIDDQGQLAATRLVESLQLRTHHSPPEHHGEAKQFVLEFVLARGGAEDPARLRAIGRNENGFSEFGDSADPFEERRSEPSREVHQEVIYKTCIGCHHEPGVQSFNTYTRFFGEQSTSRPVLVEMMPDERERASVYWKQTRYDWGLLRGLIKQ